MSDQSGSGLELDHALLAVDLGVGAWARARARIRVGLGQGSDCAVLTLPFLPVTFATDSSLSPPLLNAIAIAGSTSTNLPSLPLGLGCTVAAGQTEAVGNRQGWSRRARIAEWGRSVAECEC